MFHLLWARRLDRGTSLDMGGSKQLQLLFVAPDPTPIAFRVDRELL